MYKIVKVCPDGSLVSCFANSVWKVVYLPGVRTYPVFRHSSLFVFSEFVNAFNFVKTCKPTQEKWAVFECEADNASKAEFCCANLFMESVCFDKFWSDCPVLHKIPVPKNTYFASSVILTWLINTFPSNGEG